MSHLPGEMNIAICFTQSTEAANKTQARAFLMLLNQSCHGIFGENHLNQANYKKHPHTCFYAQSY